MVGVRIEAATRAFTDDQAFARVAAGKDRKWASVSIALFAVARALRFPLVACDCEPATFA